MALIDGKWFREENELWAGYSVGLEIDEILYKERSKYQEIFVFKRCKLIFKSCENVYKISWILLQNWIIITPLSPHCHTPQPPAHVCEIFKIFYSLELHHH